MSRDHLMATLCLLAAALVAAPAWAAVRQQPVRQQAVDSRVPGGGQVVDSIVARVGDDIITSSQVRELAAFQLLVDGHGQPADRLLSELIEQWVVNGEAQAAQFPPAAESELDREVKRIADRFATPQAYDQRLAELGLTQDSVRAMVARQILLARYLDYKFRPAVQVDDAAVESYYQNTLRPALAAKNQPVPPLDDVREQIHELLVQQGINERASSWVEDTKSRLDIEIEPGFGTAELKGK